MKNIERLQNLDIREFAEYIQSVFLAGRYYEQHLMDPSTQDFVDYEEWLNEEVYTECKECSNT